MMPEGIPSFPYHPYDIPDDKGLVDTAPTPKGVATTDNPRKLAKDLTKVALKMKAPKVKTPKRKKLDIKWY